MAAGWSHSRPDSVPVLDLAQLGVDLPEAENKLENPIQSQLQLTTPNSRSTVSWGTGLSTPYHTAKQNLNFGGTAHRPCTHLGHKAKPNKAVINQKASQPQNSFKEEKVPENLPSTSHKQKAQYAKYKQGMEEQCKNHVQNANKNGSGKGNLKAETGDFQKTTQSGSKDKSAYWYLDEELKEKQPTPKVDNAPTIDELAHMQADYTVQSYTDIHSARKYAAEDGLANKQKQQIMEQVLADQLSRHVISDPDQDKDPARSNPADPLRQRPGVSMPPLRFKSRRLHDTKVSTAGAVTETSLQSRITFSARLLTRNGRDALRELFGFFFHHDSTLTVYEFRSFGKGNFKALPFVVRGKYKHQSGRRKAKDFGSNDIEKGKNLSFISRSQPHLPETVKRHSVVTLRISEVDESHSGADGDWQISTDVRDLDTDARRERKDREVVRKIQEFVRNKLRARSVSVLMGLGRLFREIDKSGDGLLSKSELSSALQQFGIVIPDEKFESVWRVVDENNDGAIDYGEFLRAFIGEMSEFRKQIVRKVFKKLDPHKEGSASLLDMKKLYSAKNHPLVATGELSQEEMEVRFIDSFAGESAAERGRVSYVEFEEYYEGLSIVITSDNDFSNMMRNCWGV